MGVGGDQGKKKVKDIRLTKGGCKAVGVGGGCQKPQKYSTTLVESRYLEVKDYVKLDTPTNQIQGK